MKRLHNALSSNGTKVYRSWLNYLEQISYAPEKKIPYFNFDLNLIP